MLLLFFGILLLIWLYQSTRKPKNFPPGPPRLPLLGSLPYMGGSGPTKNLLSGIIEQVKEHGPVVGFYFGKTPAVIIANYYLIKEAMKNDLLALRPDVRPNDEHRPGNDLMGPEMFGRAPGIIFSHGPYWKELRRFLLRNLRDFGFGKSSMEDLFIEEVSKLCQLLSKSEGHPIDMGCTMSVSIINALWAIIVGERFDLEDPKLLHVVESINKLINGSNPSSPLGAILPSPAMLKLPIFRQISRFDFAKETVQGIVGVINPYVEAHASSLNPDDIRDFLDLMLVETKNSTNPDSCFSSKLGLHTIVNSMIDLFIAGMETTSSSLLYVFLHMLHHPEVQVKVHQELDLVVGKNRFPSLSDRENMPYVNAVLLESLRSASLAFVAVPHHAQEDVQIGGYTIPKGATVMPSLFHALRDPNHFKDPDVFNPDRFIDSHGKFFNDERVIPFGVGKRYCLGQSLAEKEFFIFFTGLMQQFQISQVPGTILPSYVHIYPKGILRTAPEYKVILRKRLQ